MNVELNEGKFKETVVCYMISDNQVLLGERKSSETGLGIGKFVGIGGHVEENETYEDTLKREIKEEVGVALTSWEFMGVIEWLYPSGIRPNMRSMVYVGHEWVGAPIETQSIKPQWFDKDNLPLDNMFHDNRYSVPRILNGEKLYAVFTYDDEGKITQKMDINPL